MIPVLWRDQQTKSPLFSSGPLSSPLTLPPLSFFESTAAVICYTTNKKKFFFPGFPAGPHPTAFFGPSLKDQEALWCRHISSVPLLCRFALFLDNRFLPKAHRPGENWSHVPGVCISVCVWKTKTNAKHCCCKLPL